MQRENFNDILAFLAVARERSFTLRCKESLLADVEFQRKYLVSLFRQRLICNAPPQKLPHSITTQQH
jgi:hypothetical protein